MNTEQTQRSAHIDPETSERDHRQSCLCGITRAAAQWVEALRIASGPGPASAQGQLEGWLAEPGQGERENRPEAVTQVRAWQERANVEAPLSLTSLALTTLPVLPPEVQSLFISNNQLSSLSIDGHANLRFVEASNNLLTSLSDAFPAGLVQLNVSGNRVSGLPAALPAGLRRLNLSNNRLTRLTDTLPATLRHLDASDNQVTDLPAALPAGLRQLNLNNNRLTSLTDTLPGELEQLDASNNQVTDLPAALPAGLRQLNLNNNRLTSLTDTLPRALEQLNASNNQVTDLPAAFPAGLRRLDLRNNQVTSLPETLPTLGSECRVQLENNPLPERVLANLASTLNSQDYAGPQIFFSMSDGTAHAQARPLRESVAAWLPNEPKTAALWRAFAEEPGAREYGRFLDKLLNTVNSSNPEFRAGVADDLRQAAARPGLRAQYFQSAIGASASCQDRITLAWNDMQTARLNADVDEGAYDKRLDKLVEQGRVMFRLDVLDGIARDKVSSLRFVDEIEVYLAYQVKLRDRLELKHIAPAMRFFGAAHVNEHDLATAEAVVRSKEAAEFANYLATSWRPWDTVLRRIVPEAHAEMQDRLVDAMGAEFESRLTERLADHHLNGDADAERQLGAKIRNEFACEIKGALTRQVLRDYRLTL